MNNYVSPSVFVESVGSANVPIEAVSASTGCFIGMTRSGPINTPILITSWQNFLDVFAKGLDTPFSNFSYLANAVYGFFQNGGTRCYVVRVIGLLDNGSYPSSELRFTHTSGVNARVLVAKTSGSWGNNLKAKFEVVSEPSHIYNIIINFNGEDVETFSNVFVPKGYGETNNSGVEHYAKVISKLSQYVTASLYDGIGDYSNITGDYQSFTGGADLTATDAEYQKALALLDDIDDINLLCAPNQTSTAMYNMLVDYADKRGSMFAILDIPSVFNGDPNSDMLLGTREAISGSNGALYNTRINVVDPLSKTGSLMDCPPCGHIMGVYARIIQERGVWKAPAGTEAVIKGALSVKDIVSFERVGELNSAGVNVIASKPNCGIVVWGARSLNTTDGNLKYVSDILLNANIKESIRQATQWAVFEPNNSVLWTKLATTIETFMDGLYRAGAFYGSEAKEAYYVKCDEELNTEAVRNAGQVICEVGYAANKPAEFVVIRIAHSINA